MPSIFSNLRKKMSGKSEQKNQSGEQNFSIQPHPAKTNDPSDLNPEQTGGLASNPNAGAFHARDPHVPSQQVMAGMEKPLSREELQARQAELNK